MTESPTDVAVDVAVNLAQSLIVMGAAAALAVLAYIVATRALFRFKPGGPVRPGGHRPVPLAGTVDGRPARGAGIAPGHAAARGRSPTDSSTASRSP